MIQIKEKIMVYGECPYIEDSRCIGIWTHKVNDGAKIGISDCDEALNVNMLKMNVQYDKSIFYTLKINHLKVCKMVFI